MRECVNLSCTEDFCWFIYSCSVFQRMKIPCCSHVNVYFQISKKYIWTWCVCSMKGSEKKIWKNTFNEAIFIIQSNRIVLRAQLQCEHWYSNKINMWHFFRFFITFLVVKLNFGDSYIRTKVSVVLTSDFFNSRNILSDCVIKRHNHTHCQKTLSCSSS